MTNELFAYDYIIALLEAAKRSTRKLKKRKIRRVLESNGGNDVFSDALSDALGNALIRYLGEKGILIAIVEKIKVLTGTSNTNTQELYELLKELAGNSDIYVQPENLYLLKPALDVMRNFVEKCEKLEKGQTGNQEPSLTGSNINQTEDQKRKFKGRRKGKELLESYDYPTKEQCEKFKDIFKLFIGKYDLTKKDIPFYKRWYYWFMSLPMWKRILIGFMFVVVLFIILLAIFKVGRKVVSALRKALSGDKAVGRKLVDIASNANPRIKNAAFSAVIDAMPKKAAMYF